MQRSTGPIPNGHTDQRQRASSATPLRVLIVDDSRDDAERIVGVLRGAGHRLVWKWVDSAGTLAVALSERDWEWHAITCGCGMAKLHHLSALHITQALAPRTPVILLTDTIGKKQRSDCVRRGARALVAKDRLQDLADMIARHVA